MSLRTWLKLGTALDVMLFFPATQMAINAINLALAYSNSVMVGAVALLFVALPVFCVLGPLAAWRTHAKRPDDLNAVFMVAAPLVYACFLVLFLLTN